ncbi:MAG: ABC transporter permease [Clostridiales bacterium]|nr:ABC transporter permease [Clostridiales bacterium]
MTFKQVAIKNFTGQLKKYLSFFLSSTFCILLFFMYAAIMFNDNINSNKDTDVLTYVFPMTIVAIGLFSIFFINYAHSTFIKGRTKEFGVYMTLGMNSNELVRLVLLENILIAAAALVTGIVVGSLFSRLFQMVLIDLLDIEEIAFYLDYRAFIVTIVSFLIVFFLNFAMTARKLKKSDIQTVLAEVRKTQKKKYTKKNLVLGVLGIIILIFALIYLVVVAKNSDLNTNPLMLLLYIVIAFTGVYLAVSQGGNFILHQWKKSRFYLNNMLTVTQLEYKYNQNKKIIFILSILSTMTIFAIASPYSLLNLCETIIDDQGQAHVEFVVDEGVHENYEEVIQENIANDEIQEQYELPMLLVDSLDHTKIPVIDVDRYNQIMKKEFHLDEGEVYNIIFDWVPSNGGYPKDSEYRFTYQGKEYTYRVNISTNGTFIAKSYPSATMLLLNSKDYDTLMQTAGKEDQFYYCVLNLKHWKVNSKAIDIVKEALKEENAPVNTVVDTYHDLKSGYSTFLFVFSIVGVLFFIAGGSVLYFRQYSELPETKKTFDQLNKIGISYKETKSIISKQLLVIFYVPAVFGCYLGLSLIYLMTHLLGGAGFLQEFMRNATFIAGLYLISQSIFYWITRRKYMSSLS